MISADPTDFPETAGDVAGRATLVRTTRPIPLECVVRGYLFGGGWQEYEAQGTVGGFAVPAGLRQAERLPEPLFTPTHQGGVGSRPAAHARRSDRPGGRRTRTKPCARSSLRLYEFGAAFAHDCGVILADTKFEFGEIDDQIIVIDEMMTPDSSRYWPAEAYQVGGSPPSFDKQYVRDFMDATGWDHDPPAPHMSRDAIANTRARYREAYELITGESFDDWFGPDNA